MGQAAQTVVADVADYAIARKRNGKPLRGTGRYTGNISVFSQRKDIKRLKVVAIDTRAYGAEPEFSKNPTPDSASQIPSDKSSIFALSSAARLVTSQTGILTVVLVVLATGAEVSSVWSSNENSEPVQFIADAKPSSEPVAAKQPITDVTTSEPEIDPVLEELNASRKLASDYKIKIEQVQALNASLQEQKDALDKETIDLNKELLQLEWEVAALEAKPKNIAGARTVYNIVNIPVGDGTTPSDYTAGSFEYSEPAYEENMEQYDNYQLTQTSSQFAEDFVVPEGYYDPVESGVDGSYEEFGKPYFN